MLRSISSAEVVRSFEQSNNLSKDKKLNDSVKRMVSEQRKREEFLINSEGVCPINQLQKHLSSLDVSKMRAAAQNEFYNADVMELTACTLQSISQAKFFKNLSSQFKGYNTPNWFADGIFYQHSNNQGNLELANTVTNWFTDMKQIGDESVAGVAMTTGLKNEKNIAVIKVPRKAGDTDFVHELFVGTRGTNMARKDIPNFAYVYGGFKCPTAVVDPTTKKVTSICGNPWMPDVQYIIYESVFPSKSFGDYAKTCSASDFFSAMVQVMLATEYGHRHFDWTHYDLHDQNVLMRSVGGLNKSFYIPYPLGQKIFYVKSTKIATIIDYGRCHIKYKGEHYGYGFPAATTYPNESFPLFDIYKLLMFTADFLNKKDPEIQRVAQAFFSYFNTSENIFDAAIRQSKTYYQLPKNEYTTKVLSIMGLLEHLRETIPVYFQDIIKTKVSTNDVTLTCDSLACRSSLEYATEIGINQNASFMASSIMDFFDQKAILITNGNKTDYERLKNNFGGIYYKSMVEHTKKYNASAASINYLEATIGNPFVPSGVLSFARISRGGIDIFRSESLTPIREMINNILTLRFGLQRLNLATAAAVDTAYSFDDITTAEKYAKAVRMIEEKEEYIMTLMYALGKYAYALKGHADSVLPLLDRERSAKSGAQWARRILPSYVNIISPSTSYQQAKVSIFRSFTSKSAKPDVTIKRRR